MTRLPSDKLVVQELPSQPQAQKTFVGPVGGQGPVTLISGERLGLASGCAQYVEFWEKVRPGGGRPWLRPGTVCRVAWAPALGSWGDQLAEHMLLP